MLASLVCFAVLTPFRSFAVCFVGCFGGGTCLPVVCRFPCVFFYVPAVFVTKTLVLFFLLFFLSVFPACCFVVFSCFGFGFFALLRPGTGDCNNSELLVFLGLFLLFLSFFCCQIDVLMWACFTGLSLVFCCARSGLLLAFFLLCFFYMFLLGFVCL